MKLLHWQVPAVSTKLDRLQGLVASLGAISQSILNHGRMLALTLALSVVEYQYVGRFTTVRILAVCL